MTARVLGWFVRRIWAPVVVAAAVGVQHTADMYAATGEFRWQALRVLIAVCALFTGIVTALTPRSTR